MTDGTAVVYSAAGRSRFLPAADVLWVGPALPACAIPGASGVYEGVDLDGPAVAVRIDLVQALGGTARTGRTAMTVRTERGPASLRVDSAALAADPGDSPPGWEEIGALMAPLGAAVIGDGPSPAEPVLPAPETGVLVVQSGNRRVALPAGAVERVERHQGAWKPLSTGAGERVVAVDGTILPGHALGAWLEGEEAGRAAPDAAESQGWAVILRDDAGQSFAMTVDAVHGLVSVPSGQIRRLPHRDGVSVWVPDGAAGLIQMIHPARTGPVPPASGGMGADAVSAPPPDGAMGTDRGAGIAVTVGPFLCVLPAGRVREVRSGAECLWSCRHGGRIPVFDAAVMLGLPPSSPDGRKTVVVERPNQEPYGLLASAVEHRAAGAGWLPLPAVPPLVHALFQAIRPTGPSGADSSLEWLVRDEALIRPPQEPAFTALVAGALAGWLEVD
ncbi:chemotaxis signal transduction protein [Azospirillum fermentarium]|uniref:chemotaxis protein CheW n=1 Tax=Azospirillum fermentarium TaxID=1233114 RepID=UPI002226BC31|nr:chemotaxis protein CheW [Azospirillum fermentarium]MCW2249390.1 chemotaxis signal transduction protein [Azospirillum fermentarium]